MLIQTLLAESTAATPIFRGVSTGTRAELGQVMTFSVRKDRKPSTSSILATMLFDRGIELTFGIHNVRRRAVFATTDRSFAGDYAGNRTPGAVLQLQLDPSTPILFHPKIDDSFSFMEGEDSDVWPKVIKLFKKMARVRFKLFPNTSGSLETVVDRLENRVLTLNDYLTKDPINAITTAIENFLPDCKEQQEYMINTLDDLAKQMVSGYNVTTAGQLSVGPEVEVIIFDIDHYNAEVAEIR